MGTPIRVEHNGEVAFLCCSGCKEAFEADPEKYLAALKADGEAAAVPEPEGLTVPATEGEPATEPAADAKAEGA
jgi:YHS domain-containing protein